MSCCGTAKVGDDRGPDRGGDSVFIDVTLRGTAGTRAQPLTSVQVTAEATVLAVRREIESDRDELPLVPREFHFLTPAGAPLPRRHEGARKAVSLRDAGGALAIVNDDLMRQPHHRAGANANDTSVMQPESHAVKQTGFFAEVHATVDGGGTGRNAQVATEPSPTESHFDVSAALVGSGGDVPNNSSSRMDDIRARHQKRLSRQASLMLDNAARADTQLADKIEEDRSKHEQKTQERLLHRRQSHGANTGKSGESKSGGNSIPGDVGSSAAAPASESLEPIDYSTLPTSLPTIINATNMKAHTAKGGAEGAMNYVTQGGLDAGRWPHPSIPMRPGSDGERSIVDRLVSTGGMRAAPAGTKKGHFPTMEAAPRIGRYCDFLFLFIFLSFLISPQDRDRATG